ncbi:MAG: bifunctional adenosylcobinamide kinase/adenosylcobinamide-phosphate guanylyltransferase [Pseudomonadota bacterium]
MTLVLGGAGSGKSAYAERLAGQSARPRHYIATAQAFDDEMAAKIERHREARGPDWITHEAPLDISAPLASIGEDAVCLLDCATLWLSNVLLAERVLDVEIAKFLDALDTASAPLIVVSNEVGMSVVPEYKLGRRFRDAQGKLNQAIAARADHAVLVIAGLPQILKGSGP